jgi:preprotein translocase subunit SecG
MGVPKGHPFFGNQFTDGGYVKGSYKYAMERIVDATTPVASKVISTQSATSITRQANLKNVTPSSVMKVNKTGLNKSHLIVVIILAVVTLGLYLICRYANKKNTKKSESSHSIELNVGICTNCENSLIESDYIHENANSNETSYIVCKNCGEKNYAWYPNESD